MRTIIAIAGNLSLLLLMAAYGAGQAKPIPVGVKVEAEGGGEGQAMWVQDAKDLTLQELKALESLVVNEIRNQRGVTIVAPEYRENYIGVVVVVAKLLNSNTRENWYYVASSVVTIATNKGIDEFVTHDVFVGTDLASLSRTIGFQFASTRFRATTDPWK
jgi:hypothetical protein